jgi:hypothetical protein
MSIPANAIMQLVLRGAANGSQILHIRNFQLVGGGLGTGNAQLYQEEFLNQVVTGGDNDLITPYLACLSSTYDLVEARAQIVTPERFAYSPRVFVGEQPGLRNPTPVDLLDGVITCLTTKAGRSQVANYKIGPIPSSDCTVGMIGDGLKAVLLTYSGTFLNTILTPGENSASWAPVIWHSRTPLPVVDADRIINTVVQETARGKTSRTLGRGI